MTEKKSTPSYTSEFRARGVRLFKENRADYASDNAAYRAIAPKLGCSPDSLRAWCSRRIAMLGSSQQRYVSLRITSATPSSLICRGVPDRGSSYSPSRRL